VVIKTLFATASVEQIPSQRGAPEWQAEIAEKPDKPQPRNNFASTLRLIQMDIATANTAAPLGWVFGTFWYNGLGLKDEYEESVREGWNRLMPVGLMWGNDPELTQAKWKAGERPKESWINPEATQLLKTLGGTRPFLGWNDRMNGPADGFISACMSCHSVAQVNVPPPPPEPLPVPPPPVENPKGVYTPEDDKVTMKWFRNIPAGEPFTPGATSTDYNMQVRSGLKNYYDWRRKNPGLLSPLSQQEEQIGGEPITGFPRSGPAITFF